MQYSEYVIIAGLSKIMVVSWDLILFIWHLILFIWNLLEFIQAYWARAETGGGGGGGH